MVVLLISNNDGCKAGSGTDVDCNALCCSAVGWSVVVCSADAVDAGRYQGYEHSGAKIDWSELNTTNCFENLLTIHGL